MSEAKRYQFTVFFEDVDGIHARKFEGDNAIVTDKGALIISERQEAKAVFAPGMWTYYEIFEIKPAVP